MKRIYLILLVLIILSSCKVRIIDRKSVNIDHAKIYFLPKTTYAANADLDPSFINGFIISDKKVIKKIVKKWKSHKSDAYQTTNYGLYFTNNDNGYYCVEFNHDLTNANTTKGEYHFEPEMLLKYKDHFEGLSKYYFSFETSQDALACKKSLINNNIYLPSSGSTTKHDWENYAGVMTLARQMFNGEEESNISIQAKIIRELAPYLNNFEVREIHFDEKSNRIILDVNLNVNSLKLPEEYEIVSDFKEFKNIGFATYGVKMSELLELCIKYKIDFKSLEEILN